MKIAILSDTHNQLRRARAALDLCRERSVELVLHCGDIEEPPVVELFRGWRAHFVFGNCDWDKDALREAMADVGATLHEPFGHVEVDGVTIGFVHGDDRGLLEDLERAGAYDFLFHGHTHVRMERQAGPTRVINPGALHRAALKTFAVLEVPAGKVEFVEVD